MAMTRTVIGSALLLSALCSVAVAHHSFATFDMTRTVTIKGTVRTFEWSNPHSWVWVDVADDKGGMATWGLEGAAPGELSRHGWNKHSINPGDKISVDIHPLKTGQTGGSFNKIEFADGHVLGAGGPGGPGGAGGPPGEAPPGAAPGGAAPPN